MIKNRIKKWLGIQENEQPKQDTLYFLVNRHYLSSISPTDADEYLDNLTESEKREYEANAALVLNNPTFQKEIKHLFALQSFFIANQSQNWEQTILGRGTVNGIGLI